MSQSDSEAETASSFLLNLLFCSCLQLIESGPPIGVLSVFFTHLWVLPVQMLTSFRNISVVTPRIMFTQISGHSLVKLTHRINHCRYILFLFVEMRKWR